MAQKELNTNFARFSSESEATNLRENTGDSLIPDCPHHLTAAVNQQRPAPPQGSPQMACAASTTNSSLRF
jgi:hypothetical protein